MPSYNRAQIRGRAQALLGEVQGTIPSGDTLGWDFILDAVADEIAFDTDCYYTAYSADFTSGTTNYCTPNLYKINSCIVYDAAGNKYQCTPATTVDLGRMYPSWQTNPASGTPRYYAVKGESGTQEVTFYPVPNYTTTGNAGFVFEGWALPSSTGWSSDSATLPLPEIAANAVIMGSALKRAQQFPKQFGEQIPFLTDEYRRAKGRVERMVAEYDQAQRHLDVAPKRNPFGSYGGY